MVAQLLAMALDPVRLAEQMGLAPDDWQVEVLRSSAQQQLLLCSRQAGKSTTTAVLAAHEALFRPGSLTILVSPSQRQSAELFRKVRDQIATIDAVPAPSEESALRLELPNESRIVSLPAKEATIRGYSGVNLVIEDEAARVPDPLYQAIRPMLAVSGGRMVLLSTPWGKRGHFYDEWVNGGSDWHRVQVTAVECPRISADWLERERRRIPEFVFRQEYLCEFVDPDDQLIDSAAIAAATDFGFEPLLFGGSVERFEHAGICTDADR